MRDTVTVREIWYVDKTHLLNRVIAAVTWLPNIDTEPVSHCELWEADRDGDFRGSISKSFYGQCWTSTTRGKHNGTCVRPAISILNNPEWWYYTEHEVCRGLFELAKSQAQIRVNTNLGYSFRDLARFVMPLWVLKITGLAHNGKEICSEHLETWEVDMKVLKKQLIRSPRRLCKAVVLATGSPLRRLIDNVKVRDENYSKPKGI